MKAIPIKYTFDMINDQALLRMAKSMESLNQTILSLKQRLIDGVSTLDSIYNSMYGFNIGSKQQQVYDISIRQKELIDAYNKLMMDANYANALIINSKKQLDEIINKITGGNRVDQITTTTYDISSINDSQCIVEQIKIIFNNINRIGQEQERIQYFKSLPIVDQNAVIQNGTNEENQPPEEGEPEQGTTIEQKNENVLAYIASSKVEGQIMCAGRFAQLLVSKFKIKNQNIKFFIKKKNSGTLTCSAMRTGVKVSYTVDNDIKLGDAISNANIPENGMVFVCVQDITTKTPDIQEIVDKINSITNSPIFILLDIGNTSSTKYFIDNITTSNPCLVWSSPHSMLVSSNNSLTADGGYLMNLMQQIITPTSTEYEKISYQMLFDLMKQKYDKISKTNLNDFNETLPIFTI